MTSRQLKVVSCSAAFAVLAVLATAARAQDLAAFEGKTTSHVLANGWTFIIHERPVAPVFSFATLANVGGAQEVPGITGLAHMFEHMAFKGTPNIGSKDYAAEKEALEELEAAYQEYQAARLARRADPQRVAELRTKFEEKQEQAVSYVVPGAFDEIVEREGGVGLNAFTSSDFTGYVYSLPANKFELFCFLESERFLHPVFREFYKERDVVQEERRLRTESQPIARLIEQFLATAFVAHPYGQPTVGYMSDLESITISDAKRFFDTYYAPSNLITVLTGDVKAEEILPLIERYFSRVPARPAPPVVRTVEPEQIAEKTIVLRDPAQPFYAEAYHKPDSTGVDEPVYDAIDDILSGGRTSRLYRSLVRDEKVAVNIGSFSSFPGAKYPTLWIGYALPATDATNEDVQSALRNELEKLKSEDVGDEELDRFKTRARAELLRSLSSNSGLALALAQYQSLFGDWRELFHYLGRIDAVSKEDIRRVANETFRAANRTVGMIVTQEAATATAADAG